MQRPSWVPSWIKTKIDSSDAKPFTNYEWQRHPLIDAANHLKLIDPVSNKSPPTNTKVKMAGVPLGLNNSLFKTSLSLQTEAFLSVGKVVTTLKGWFRAVSEYIKQQKVHPGVTNVEEVVSKS